MRRVALVGILGGLVMAACDRDPEGADCVCQPQTALETAFDNASSTLGADNVQDALDELAARPLPGRTYLTDWHYLDATLVLPGGQADGHRDRLSDAHR